jgi:hypothetical protein
LRRTAKERLFTVMEADDKGTERGMVLDLKHSAWLGRRALGNPERRGQQYRQSDPPDEPRYPKLMPHHNVALPIPISLH